MKRRTLLRLGFAGATAMLVGGAVVAWLRPGWSGTSLTPAGRELFSAVATGVLADLLPSEPGARAAALDAYLTRLELEVAGLHPVTQQEIAQMSGLLAHPAGRLALAGLTSSWGEAAPQELEQGLQNMRHSSLAIKQQVYHALRDLTNGAWFADPAAWAAMGYPGPRSV